MSAADPRTAEERRPGLSAQALCDLLSEEVERRRKLGLPEPTLISAEEVEVEPPPCCGRARPAVLSVWRVDGAHVAHVMCCGELQRVGVLHVVERLPEETDVRCDRCGHPENGAHSTWCDEMEEDA